MLYIPTFISIIEVLLVTVPVLLTVAFVTVAERKTMASMQRRLGPNVVGYYGLLQAFADALKLLLKEYISPTQANLVLFFLGPIITLIFSLLGYAVIPYGPGLALWDFNLGILYMLAVSSLATYGILLAGWSANSKYAFLGSKWPSRDVNFYLFFSHFKEKIQRTVCEKFIKIRSLNLLGTLYVTPLLFILSWGFKVKILLNVNNSQVTKAFISLVGTSEAIRSLSIICWKAYRSQSVTSLMCLCTYNYLAQIHTALDTLLRTMQHTLWCKKPLSNESKSYYSTESYSDKKLHEWLAGLIDGDGSFYLSKTGHGSLEITMDIIDERALQIIKNVYGGSIKRVYGKNALRYCLRHKKGLTALINDVNGNIRNSYRLIQLNKICTKYDILTIYPNKLKFNNGWLSGFFDADGAITLNSVNGQVAIALTQKTAELLQPLTELYGGYTYVDKGNNAFKWYISDKEGISKLIDYFKKYPSRSLKMNRILLLPKCYRLKQMKAHKSIDRYLSENWKDFVKKWNNYEKDNK